MLDGDTMKCEYCESEVVIIDDYGRYAFVQCTNEECGETYNIKKDDTSES